MLNFKKATKLPLKNQFKGEFVNFHEIDETN